MYQLGNLLLNIVNHQNISIPENMNKFFIESNTYDYQYDLYVIDCIDIEEDQFTINKREFDISKKLNI